MTLVTWSWVFLFVYVGAMIAIGVVGQRRVKHADDFARSFSKALMSFAAGRPLDYRDEERLSRVTDHFRDHDHRMDELVKVIVDEHCLNVTPVKEKPR